MRDIPFGTLGLIKVGEGVGRYVEVLDDADNTGGFLICTYADANRSPEAFDDWVETRADVDAFFDDRGWDIEWVGLDARYYEELRGGMMAVLVQAKGALTDAEASQLHELIDANEPGVALEILVQNLSDADKRVDDALRRDLLRLSRRMGLAETTEAISRLSSAELT